MSQEPTQPPPDDAQEAPVPVSPAEVYLPAEATTELPPKNDAGLYGLILSLTGIVCWVTFPIGLVVSLLALRRKPRVLAAVGSFLGGVGTLFLVVFLVAWGNVYLALFSSIGWLTPQLATQETMEFAAGALQEEYDANSQPPDPAKAITLIASYLDAWGNTFRYEPKENGTFELRSAGEDGTFDTEDDILYGETFGVRPLNANGSMGGGTGQAAAGAAGAGGYSGDCCDDGGG